MRLARPGIAGVVALALIGDGVLLAEARVPAAGAAGTPVVAGTFPKAVSEQQSAVIMRLERKGRALFVAVPLRA